MYILFYTHNSMPFTFDHNSRCSIEPCHTGHMTLSECSNLLGANPAFVLTHNMTKHCIKGTIENRPFSIIKNDGGIFEFRFSKNAKCLHPEDFMVFLPTIASDTDDTDW